MGATLFARGPPMRDPGAAAIPALSWKSHPIPHLIFAFSLGLVAGFAATIYRNILSGLSSYGISRLMRRLAISVERFPILGNFVISRGAKAEAAVVVATIEDRAWRGRGEGVPYARYG